jgi:hypothetical protein
VAAAAGLHLLVGLGLLILAAQPPRPQPGVVSINLVASGGMGARPVEAAVAAASPPTFADLADRLAEPPATEAAASQTAEATPLSQLLGAEAGSAPAAGGGEAVVDDRYSRASFDPGARAPPDAQIAQQARRCWRGSPGDSAVVVEATLARDGALIGRPKVVRTSAARPAAAQARAEQRALVAVADCAPYRLTAPGGRDTRVAIVLG